MANTSFLCQEKEKILEKLKNFQNKENCDEKTNIPIYNYQHYTKMTKQTNYFGPDLLAFSNSVCRFLKNFAVNPDNVPGSGWLN